MADERRVTKLLDGLREGRNSEEVLGEDELLDELTKRLMERVLEGELTDHLGYEKPASEGRCALLRRSIRSCGWMRST